MIGKILLNSDPEGLAFKFLQMRIIGAVCSEKISNVAVTSKSLKALFMFPPTLINCHLISRKISIIGRFYSRPLMGATFAPNLAP